jgi:hypothetical protein
MQSCQKEQKQKPFGSKIPSKEQLVIKKYRLQIAIIFTVKMEAAWSSDWYHTTTLHYITTQKTMM